MSTSSAESEGSESAVLSAGFTFGSRPQFIHESAAVGFGVGNDFAAFSSTCCRLDIFLKASEVCEVGKVVGLWVGTGVRFVGCAVGDFDGKFVGMLGDFVGDFVGKVVG